MSARLAQRLVLRQSRWSLQRRAASTTSETVASSATKAKEATQEAASKAQSGLSRVTSSAGAAVGSAGSALGNAISGIGGRTGRLIGFVQSLVPPTVYYGRVVGELGKLIYQGRAMSPPTLQTMQTYIAPVQNAVRNPSTILNSTQQVASSAGQTATSAASNPQGFLARLRDLDTATLTTVGVVTAEAVGFFTIGEMIGRFKIIGYHGNPHGDH